MNTTNLQSKHTVTNLEQFYEELLKNPILQEQLKTATDPENLVDLAVELGKEKGYNFTKEEVIAAMAIEVTIGVESLEIGETFNYLPSLTADKGDYLVTPPDAPLTD